MNNQFISNTFKVILFLSLMILLIKFDLLQLTSPCLYAPRWLNKMNLFSSAQPSLSSLNYPRPLHAIRPKVYETLGRDQPELLESDQEVLKADSNLSICINFTVFSFVMAYNNKKVGALFGCNVAVCVSNQHLWFSKFPIFKIIWICRIRFWVFRR